MGKLLIWIYLVRIFSHYHYYHILERSHTGIRLRYVKTILSDRNMCFVEVAGVIFKNRYILTVIFKKLNDVSWLPVK